MVCMCGPEYIFIEQGLIEGRSKRILWLNKIMLKLLGMLYILYRDTSMQLSKYFAFMCPYYNIKMSKKSKSQTKKRLCHEK